jgi:AcrR family transcriptional regulator
MTRVPAEPDEADPVITPSVTRIRAAALHLFAEHGTEATPLRAVAAGAGVSLGLVQHHFGTKAGLVDAVDREVLRVLSVMMAEPMPEPPADPVAEVGQRVSSLIAEQPDVVNYLSRAFVTGGALGTMIFDALAANGAARWNELHDHEQQTRETTPRPRSSLWPQQAELPGGTASLEASHVVTGPRLRSRPAGGVPRPAYRLATRQMAQPAPNNFCG